MTLIEVLDRGRAAAGSQANMARALGVSEPTVSRWYSGKGVPDFESCLRLARLTKLPPRVVVESAGRDASLLPPGDQGPHQVDPSRYVDLDELDPVRRGVVEDIRQGAEAHGGRLIRTNVHSVRKVAYRAHERQAAA